MTCSLTTLTLATAGLVLPLVALAPPTAQAAPAAGDASSAPISVTDDEPAYVDGTWKTADLPALRTVTVDRQAVVSDVDVTIVAARPDLSCDQPAAGNNLVAEMYERLVSPSGTTVPLVRTWFEDGGATYGSTVDGGTRTIDFDDEAADPAGPAFVSGTFRPAEPLAAFDGEQAAGTWTLQIGDSSGGGQPTCHYSFTLDISTVACDDATQALAHARTRVAAWKARVMHRRAALGRARESGNQVRIDRARLRLQLARVQLRRARADVVAAQRAIDRDC